MTAFTQKTDITDAVNLMIGCAGEAPISSYDDDTNVMARLAFNTLVETHRAVLSRGWGFNTDDDYSLTPDINGQISIPEDVISIDTDAYTDRYDPVIRSGKLYSRKEQSFVWTSAITAEVVRLMEFEDIPEPARRYIAIRAARVFVARYIGDRATFQYTAADEADALGALQSYEMGQSDFNILNSPEARAITNRYP